MRSANRALSWLAIAALSGCAQPADTAPARVRTATYSAPVVLFVQPDSAEIQRMHRELGDDAFYATADDAMWYQAQAIDLLDSLRIPHADVRRGEARFVVHGKARPFTWNNQDRAWFLVIYDGANEPVIASAVELREHLPHPMAHR
ncbi:MAG TPA: hypothetical protein VFJ16_00050 [Longimicrobium sp.]|nr:hypothetical protein [Longimicrobium sp.]